MLTCTTGLAFAERPGVFVLTDHPAEFDAEAVFHALNRIDEDHVDIVNLPTFWQQALRASLAVSNAPSMSTGDRIYWTSNAGEEIGVWTCESTGWAFTSRPFDTRAAAMNGRHINFVICPQGATP